MVMWQPQVPKKPNQIRRSPAQHPQHIYFVICKAALRQPADGVCRAKRFAEDAGYRGNNRVGHRLSQIATREKVYRLSRRRKNLGWTEQTWLTKTGTREQKQIRTGYQAANPYRQLPYHHECN
jgi:hypothetical protein